MQTQKHGPCNIQMQYDFENYKRHGWRPNNEFEIDAKKLIFKLKVLTLTE